MLKKLKSVLFIISRNDDDSYARGVLSKDMYASGKKRGVVSFKICMICWLIELLSTLSFAFWANLRSFGLHNLHYADCITMFVIIPIVHLTNDEETRGIIAERDWCQGFRHMIGVLPKLSRNN